MSVDSKAAETFNVFALSANTRPASRSEQPAGLLHPAGCIEPTSCGYASSLSFLRFRPLYRSRNRTKADVSTT